MVRRAWTSWIGLVERCVLQTGMLKDALLPWDEKSVCEEGARGRF